MKEKIKNIILITSITYSIIIIVAMFFTPLNMTTTIELYDNENNINELKEYKKQLATMDKNECTKVISDLITYYEATSYKGKINLKDKYNYEFNNIYLNYYEPIKNNCNIPKEDEDKLPIKFITASIQNDELFQKYIYQYELNFKDYYTRLDTEASMESVEYNINRKSQLEIISYLINLNNKEDNINE